jgi:hypothetical protein
MRAISQSSLIKRGWTKRLISTLLGQPIKLMTNPYWWAGPKMKAYDLDAALEAEKDPRFQLFQIQRARRREAALSHQKELSQ